MAMRVGVDLVAVATVAEALEGPLGARFLARIFTARELDDCRAAGRVDPRRLAARFAAKEAVVKVLATDEGFSWREIEVAKAASGAAQVVLHGRAAELATDAGIVDIALSLSHEDGMAVALAVADVRATSGVGAAADPPP
jgi:holo-[acyl-carrier protein] synthase